MRTHKHKTDFVESCPTCKPIAEADLNMLEIRVETENLPMATTENKFANMLVVKVQLDCGYI